MAYYWVVTNVPSKLHSNGILAICPNNKPFFAETLKAGKSSGGATKAVIGEADCVIILRWRFG
jgi:hypothetical protein